MDDTLFDHTNSLRAALGELRRAHPFLRRRSLDAMAEEYARLIGDTHADVALGRISSEEMRAYRFARLAEWAGRTVDPEIARELSTEYRGYYQRVQRPVGGAPEFVRALAGRTRIGVVTNNTLAEQRKRLVFLGLDRVVDPLITSEEVGVQKPDPALFRAALERGGVAPEQAVMVGDSWAMDVVGARASGIRPVWFNRFRLASPAPAAVPEFASFRAHRKLERMLCGDIAPS